MKKLQFKKPSRYFFIVIVCLFAACGSASQSATGKATPTVASTPTQTARLTLTSTANPTPMTTASTFFGYSFPESTEGWDSSENGNGKTVSIIDSDHSLEVKSQLGGDKNNIFFHTETKVNMYGSQPEGYTKLPSYNWKSKVVTVVTIFPTSYIGVNVDLYVVTILGSSWYNQRQVITLNATNTGHPIEISLEVGIDKPDVYTDNGFDPTAIGAIGVRVVVPGDFKETNDPFYIKKVVVPSV